MWWCCDPCHRRRDEERNLELCVADSEGSDEDSIESVSTMGELHTASSSPQAWQDQEGDSLFFTPQQLVPASAPVSLMSSLSAPAAMQEVSTLGPAASPVVQPDFTSLRSVGEDMTTSLVNYAKHLPAAQAPKGGKPIFTEHLKKTSMLQIRRAMRVEPFWLARFLKDKQDAYDFKKFRWKEGSAIKGTLVRGLRFRMPLPNDLPASVARMVQVPDESRATVLVRLGGAGQNAGDEEDLQSIADSEPVVFVQQSCTHDAPYGENFRVQDTLHFSAHGSGGVVLQRWTEVIWLKALPWALGMLKPIIESKAVAGTMEAHKDIMFELQKALDKVS